MKKVKIYFILMSLTAVASAQDDPLQDLIHGIQELPETARSAQEKDPVKKPASLTDLSIWDTERFQNEFMGSYGVNAEIEPRVSAVEREDMQKVMDILSEEDDLEKALKLLLKETKEASSAIFDFTIGNLYFQQENQNDAMAWYEKAIEKFPTFRRAYKNAGLIYVREGEYEKALPYLTKTIELGGHTSIAYGLLGFAYASTEQHLCAESAYRMAILLAPKTLDWQLGLARSLFKQQKFGDAVSLCDELLKKQPASADFWLLQANAYLGLKQPMRAAENYEYVAKLGQATVQSMGMLGDIYVNEERFDMAADAYLKAYEVDSKHDASKPLRSAEILAVRGANTEAGRVLDRIEQDKLALGKKNLTKLLKLKARIAASEGDGSNEVVTVLEEVVTLDPLDGEALILLGQHFGREVPEKAMFYYERAANIEQFEADAVLLHGQLLVGMSKYRDAIPLLRRAYELKPRSDLQDYLKQVERIAKSRG